jgi:hypothetical protein
MKETKVTKVGWGTISESQVSAQRKGANSGCPDGSFWWTIKHHHSQKRKSPPRQRKAGWGTCLCKLIPINKSTGWATRQATQKIQNGSGVGGDDRLHHQLTVSVQHRPEMVSRWTSRPTYLMLSIGCPFRQAWLTASHSSHSLLRKGRPFIMRAPKFASRSWTLTWPQQCLGETTRCP